MLLCIYYLLLSLSKSRRAKGVSGGLISKEGGGEITITSIWQQGNNGLALVLWALCQLNSSSESCARGNTYQYTLGSSKLTTIFESILVINRENLIINLGVQGFRDEACTNALNLVRASSSASSQISGPVVAL